MSGSFEDYRVDYVGVAYEITQQVSTFHGITRFGRTNDITDLLSADQDAQASYVAGLIALVIFSMSFFVFWIVGLLTFKCMGNNAGFLSGSPLKSSSDDKTSCFNKQVVLRVLFLAATSILWLSAVLLLVKGVTDLDSTADAADSTLLTLRGKIEEAEEITNSVQQLGIKSVKIRDKVVYLFDTVICDALDLESTLGVSLSDLKERARDDLNKLSDFLYDSLAALLSGIDTATNLTESAESVVSEIRLGGWPAILVSGLLFILPSFFVVGVFCAFKNVRAKRFQQYLSFVILPIFMGVIGFCIILCCVLIPVAAMNADFCTGPNSGGPDDTILTSYRNLFGNDQSKRFYIVAYYTQRCLADYYPYDFLGSYYKKLIIAQTSVDQLISTLSGNLDIIEQQCGTTDGELFLSLAQSMQSSLASLKSTVDKTMDLVNCEDINKLYANAVHSATCTYAPEAMYWIYGTLFAISLSGMIMITLRSSYLTPQQDTGGLQTKEINPAKQRVQESALRIQQLYREHKRQRYAEPKHSTENIPEEMSSPPLHQYQMNDTPYGLPPYLSHRDEDGFVVITPEEQDDISALD